MIKRFSVVLAMVIAVSAIAQTERPFSIKGQFTNMPHAVQKVYLSYRLGDAFKTDSIVPVNGNYSFSGALAEPVLANMRIKYEPGEDGKTIRIAQRDVLSVFVNGADNVFISSVDSFRNAKISGSKANDEYVKLNALLKPVTDKRMVVGAEYSKARAEKNEAGLKAASDKLDELDLESQELYGVYAKQNMQSPIMPFALAQYAGWDLNVPVIEPLYDRLTAEQKATPTGVALASQIASARKTMVGETAMEFTQNDTLGKPVSLSSFRGKYVLVDFWASWCGPCRMENPNVVKAYQAYKNKNFTILGVSLDRPNAKDKWIEAIHNDNLTWTHVSELNYWQSNIVKQYGIMAIPQNLLIDPKGKIVGKNLSGDKLKEKLAELLP